MIDQKAIIKGKTPREKKIKYLNQFELHTLIADLDIKEEPNWDWFIFACGKDRDAFFKRRLLSHRRILILEGKLFL